MSTPAQEMIPNAPAFCEGILHFGPRAAQFDDLGAAPVVDPETGSISTIDEAAVFQTRLMADALRYTTRGKILLGCRRLGAHVRIEVWDTGPGIPEERLGEIFEEFRRLQTKDRLGEKGLGLGLAIARSIAEAHGGAINVLSRPGVGSTFRVELPLVAVGREEVADQIG